MKILFFIIGLSFLIFFHEFGHFIAAKLSGVYVYEFSLFMGPKIFQFKIGETKYTLRCLPIGGYCSMAGEQDAESERNEKNNDLPEVPFERTINGVGNFKKLMIMFAGPLFNIVLSIVLMLIYSFATFNSNTTIKEGSKVNEYITSANIEITDLGILYYENMANYDLDCNSGKKENYLSGVMNSATIETYYTVEQIYDASFTYLLDSINSKYKDVSGIPVDFNYIQVLIINNEYEIPNEIYFNYDVIEKELTNLPKLETLGLSCANSKMNFKEAFGYTFRTEGTMLSSIFVALGQLFTKDGFNNVAGVVGMYSIASTYMDGGFMYFLYFLALISINLGVMNLLPFPALDGGRIVLTLFEVITKKKPSAKVEGIINIIGFAILIILMIAITIKDVIGLF